MWLAWLTPSAVTVCSDGTCDYPSLQHALDEEEPLIQLVNDASFYGGSVVSDTEIFGDPTARPTLVPPWDGSVDAVLVVSGASLTLRDVVLDAGSGRGVLVQYGQPSDAIDIVLDDVDVMDGSTEDFGGGVYLYGVQSLTIIGGTFDGGHANLDGGCVYVAGPSVGSSVGSVTVTGATFDGCDADASGSALAVRYAASLSIADTTFRGGSAGAVDVKSTERVEIVGSVFDGNGGSGDSGVGAVHTVEVGRVAVEGSWFCENVGKTAAALDLGIGSCGGGCSVSTSVFADNDGTAIAMVADGVLDIHRSTFQGAALGLLGGTATLDRVVVSDPGEAAVTTSGGASVEVVSGILAAEVGSGVGVDAAKVVRDVEPVFFDGFVASPCGAPVVLHPWSHRDVPEVADWDSAGGAGAFTAWPDPPCGDECEDADADGSPAMWDCAEDDPVVGHDAAEKAADGVDQDCDGTETCYVDFDQDGYGRDEIPGQPLDCEGDRISAIGGDCVDDDAAFHPGADDPPGDGADQDCDGLDGPDTTTGPGTGGADDRTVPIRSVDWIGGGGCGCAAGPGPALAGIALPLAGVLVTRRRCGTGSRSSRATASARR